MKLSRVNWLFAAALALVLHTAFSQTELILPTHQNAQLDRTSFIISFDESIGDPVAVATIASSDADFEAVRSAAEAQERAAAAAADRIGRIASDAGITVVHSETFGHVMTGILLKVASEADGDKLSELLRKDESLGIRTLNNVMRFKVDFNKLKPEDTAAAAAMAAATAAAAADPAFAEPTIWGGADQATLVDMAQSRYTGQGVRVAVVDDGLDYTHPSFGSCTHINSGGKCRVVAGKDFTDGDAKTYDACGSHGTHVAGIIAGDAMNIKSRTVPWRGVAYKASLGAYRVFACDGMTQNDWLLQAIEQAVKDRMTIINLSMGTSWTQPLGLEFTTRLAKQGVLVVAAAGNSGADGLWTYGAPASEPDSFAVGSTDNTYSLGAALALDTSIKVRGDFTRQVDATARALLHSPLPSTNTALVLPSPRAACSAIINKAAVAGKIAVVQLGTCDEMTKARHLLDAGAASVLFYNNQPYPAFKQSMNIDNMAGAKQMFCTDLATGAALTAALEAGRNIKLTRIVSKRYLNPNAEKISWFSSWGPEYKLRLLPTFAAPGGGILSSIPGNNFAEFQGTSMATPYASGALTLWREANKGRLGSGRSVLEAAKEAFINTALPIKVDKGRFAHSVVMAGAGLIQVNSAIDNKVEVSPSYLSLPTGQAKTSVVVSFTNTGRKRVAYRLGHTPAVAVSTEDAWYVQEKTEKLAAEVTFRNSADTQTIQTISIAPGARVQVRAVISIDNQLRSTPMFYSGYLTLTPINPAQVAEVSGLEGAGARRLLQEPLAAATADAAVEAAAAAAASDAADVPALSVPYMSLSQQYSQLPVLAARKNDVAEGRVLVNNRAFLCNLLDGTCATDAAAQIVIDPLSLGIGSITFALPLSRPIESAWVEIYNANSNQYMGKTQSLGPVAWAGPKALLQFPEHVSGSYFKGDYQASNDRNANSSSRARLGSGTYRFVLVVKKPVALGDAKTASANAAQYIERIEVLGRLVVQNSGVGGSWGG